MINPFSSLPLQKKAIDIHSKYEIPGAAEYVVKDKDDKKTRSKKTGNSQQTGQQTGGGMGQVSTSNVNRMGSDTRNGQDSSKRQ